MEYENENGRYDGEFYSPALPQAPFAYSLTNCRLPQTTVVMIATAAPLPVETHAPTGTVASLPLVATIGKQNLFR